jgi:hypothetical protein
LGSINAGFAAVAATYGFIARVRSPLHSGHPRTVFEPAL